MKFYLFTSNIKKVRDKVFWPYFILKINDIFCFYSVHDF